MTETEVTYLEYIYLEARKGLRYHQGRTSIDNSDIARYQEIIDAVQYLLPEDNRFKNRSF